ncbi:MAG: AsmA-like C-terminal domain-containing protein [Deltaproteobacteria bacterium]|nr:AsmA-like C-terminal domain-containing protein [Deltaproteobacteria bacterium]
MSRPKKIIIGIIIGTAMLLFGLAVLLPALINTDAINAKIIEAASQSIDGQVDFERIQLALLPRPHAIIFQGRMAVRDSVQGKWVEMSVFPRLSALLFARLEVADLKVKQPDFKLKLPASSGGKTSNSLSFLKNGDLRQQIEKGLGALVAVVKDVKVTIDDGHLSVLTQDKAPLEWQDITADLSVSDKRVTVDLTCRSSFFQKITLKSEVDPDTLNLNGKVTLQGLAPHPLMAYWRPDSDLKITDGSVDLTLQFQSQGWSIWQGDFETRTSMLKVQNDTRQTEIGPAFLNGRFNFSSSQMTLQIDRLDLDNPQLSLAGKLLVDSSETAGVHLKANGQDINANAVRATALSLGGHIPDVREVFDIVKGGQIPTIKVEVQSKDWADLSEFERWRIDGEMKAGAIFIPTVNLDLTDVFGHAIIENGILTAENVRASYGKTQGRQGSLKIGLTGDAKPFHLDMDVNADLAPLPLILDRVIDNKKLKPELSRIEHLSGMATGKLILGENMDDISVQIDVSEFDLKARYNRLPYPLSVKGGRFQFKGDEIRIGDLSAQMQNTHFSKISGRVNWGHTAELDVQTGAGAIVLSEIYPWLKKHGNLAESLKTIDALNGSIAVSALNLKGPYSRPSAWRFNISGDIQNLAVKTLRLPQKLVLPRGHFKLAPELLTLSKSRARLLDLETDFSLRIVDYMKGVNKLHFSGSGKMGPNFTQWVTNEIKIPAQYHLKPPISFKSLDVDWTRSGEITAAGSMTTSNGPTVTADIRYTPAEIDIRQLTIQDNASNAEFVLKHKPKAKVTDLSFKGNLAKVTLDKFWKENRFLEGTVKGNLDAKIDSNHPLNSVVKGNLEAHQVFLPLKAAAPLRIDYTVLSASKKKLMIHEADINWLGNQFHLDGHLTFKPGSIFLEMNATGEEIDTNQFETLFKDNGKKTSTDETPSPSIFQGTLHIDTQLLKYGFYTWSPFRATLMLEKNSLTMRIHEAVLCGIETPGTVKFSPNGIWLEIIPNSQPREIQHATGCLTGKSTSEMMEGQFQTAGTIKTEGKTADELLRNLKGDMEFTVKDGRVYNTGRVGIFTNIFSFLKINRLVKGNVPDLKNNDFRYKSLSAKFYFQDGKFILTEGYIDGESLGIVATEGEFNLLDQTLDLRLLVSPLKTVDTIVKHIPIINKIFQGTLIAIPVKVEGDVSNPKVTALSPSAFGSEAMGIIERTLKAPVKIVDPILTDTSDPKKTDGQSP